MSLKSQRKAVVKGLRALPPPKNDFEIVLPEEDDDEMDGGGVGNDGVPPSEAVPDAAEVDEEMRAKALEKERQV